MNRRPLTLPTLLFFAGMAFLAAWYATLLAYLLTDYRGLKGGADYLAHYSAGYIVRYVAPDRLYDLDLQLQVQQMTASPERVTRYYYYNHPPFLAGLLGRVTTRDYDASYFRWALLLFVFHSTSLGLLLAAARRSGWQKKELWILGISGLLFAPLLTAYLKGQDSAFLLLGVSLWTFGLLTAHGRVAGLGLALAAIRPQVALALAVPFLFKQRKIWWWFLAWGSILLGYSYLLVGAPGLAGFARVLLSSGLGMGIDVDKMATLMGALLRLFPHIDPALFKVIGYGGYVLTVVFLCCLWAKAKSLEFRHIGLALLLGMVFSPHMHSHDLSLLLVPALGAAVTLAGRRAWARGYAALLPLGVSVLLALNDILSTRIVIYLLMLALGLCLWFPRRFGQRKEAPQAC